MTTLLNDLEARAEKARSKVERCEKALEAARLELSEFETALRVVRNMSGESPGVGVPASVSTRQRDILSVLYEGRENSQAPAQAFEGYKLIGDVGISLDTFRTTLWRMADNEFVVNGDQYRVFREDSRYWKQKQLSPPSASEGSAEFGRVAELDGPQKTEQRPFRNGENVGSSPTPPSPVQTGGGFADDLDDDIPF